MREWWHWSPPAGDDVRSFGVVGVGRFGSAVCRQLMQNGAEVLAVDRSSKAIEELRQLEPSIEARVLDCTEEESLREAGILVDMRTDRSHSHTDRQGQCRNAGTTGDRKGDQRPARKDAEACRCRPRGVSLPHAGSALGLELVRLVMERLELDDHNSIEEIKVPERFLGQSLRELNLRKNYRVNVLAAGPAGELMVNPPASYVLMDGHVLVVMGLTEDLQNLPRV